MTLSVRSPLHAPMSNPIIALDPPALDRALCSEQRARLAVSTQRRPLIARAFSLL